MAVSRVITLSCNQLRHLRFLSSCKHISTLETKTKNDKPAIILGIESSCDDTGCGIVNTEGKILGEAIHTQHTHQKYGGIIPVLAKNLHKQNITKVCEDALKSANLRLRDIDAIACTIKPGLSLSLVVGRNFGSYLSRIGNKPFIPIHHMEAHALTARMTENVDYPFLALLISGGHCILALVQEVNKFYVLGSSKDHAPGEILDKVARQMKLHIIPEYKNIVGGMAIEKAAMKATAKRQFIVHIGLSSAVNCMFSFSAIKNMAIKYINMQEVSHNITCDKVIPDMYNLCYDVQYYVATHICHRVQRAIEFINEQSLLPKDKRTLVVSGGVACNNFIANALSSVCSHSDYRFVRTPPTLCTDNGVMVAWNGAEKWLSGIDVIRDRNIIDSIEIEKNASLGEDWSAKIDSKRVDCNWISEIKNL